MYKYPYGDSQQLNLDWILAKIKELEASGADLEEVSNALISLTYNTNTAYRRYDYAFLNGKLYRCLTDTTGAFDPAAWMEVRIGEDIPVLTRLLNAVDASLTTLQDRAVIQVQDKTADSNTLDNIVNHALAQITAGITSYGKLFTFRTNNGTGINPNEYFGNSRVYVICNFQQNTYGCGLLLSDNPNNIAAFVRRNNINTLYPIGDFQSEISNLNGAINALTTEVIGTITKHTSITTGSIDSQLLRRVGNLVNIGGRVYNMSNQIANANFFMISENCRPNVTRKLMCTYVKEDDTQSTYYVNVNPDGTVYLGVSNSLKIKQIMVVGTYPI